jgi:hypothetical protein
MSDSHSHVSSEEDLAYFPPEPHKHPVSRRGILQLLGGMSAMALAPSGLVTPAFANSFNGLQPIRTAMHVHGAWSEGGGSWAAVGPVAKASNTDVVMMTDHGYRAEGTLLADNLGPITFARTTTGSLVGMIGEKTADTLHLRAESTTASEATVKMSGIDANLRPNLRSSIAGTTLNLTLKSGTSLTGGAKLEIVVTLSKHPATGGRAAGVYQLNYRYFAGAVTAKWTENNGLTGVYRRPLPAVGSVFQINLETDVANMWPGLAAVDNGFYNLEVVARSMNSNSVADVILTCSFTRTRHDIASIKAQQRQLANLYTTRYGVVYHPAVEAFRTDHFNFFSNPQYIPASTGEIGQTRQEQLAFYRQSITAVHGLGGTVSWNHPFGADHDAELTATEQDAERRRVAQFALNNGMFGGFDIMEAGYVTRGQASFRTHQKLADVFARMGFFITANGVNDDHDAGNWVTKPNGFLTGIYAASTAMGDLNGALRAGRAFMAHPGTYPSGELDLLVDDTVLMGKASVSSKLSRTLDIQATNLPTGSTVELITGVIDYNRANLDPITTTRTFAKSAFSAAGALSVQVDTSRPVFCRTQVFDSTGRPIGASNPVYLLRQPPTGGIPATRVA